MNDDNDQNNSSSSDNYDSNEISESIFNCIDGAGKRKKKSDSFQFKFIILDHLRPASIASKTNST